MPDITMCSSNGCPMKEECYRSRAKTDTLQSWSNFEYSCNENSGYENFIKHNKKGWFLVESRKEIKWTSVKQNMKLKQQWQTIY